MRKILSLVLGLLWTLPSWAGTSSDYTKLEYIESTGRQYIDTGYKFSAGNKFEVVLNPLNNIQQGWFFGANSAGGEVLFSNGSIYFGSSFRPSTASTSGLFPTTNTIYKITGDMRDASSNQSSLLIDDNLIWQGTGTFNGRKIYLFAVISSANDESSLARQKIRIYGFKIWQNDTIVQDLIPVKRHSDGVICMYDMVTGEFFENIGTGTFVAGPVAEIKIATTKYNETAFGPLNTALANAISVVDTVVSNTITQAGRIATLQAQKQTRPADDPSDANNAENCPAGKKCLLVEDASGVPHWYEIVEQYSRLPEGFTELQWIKSTGSQWVNTEYKMTSDIVEYGIEIYGAPTSSTSLFGSETSSGITYSGVPYASGSSVSVFIGRSSSLSGMIFPASQWNTYTIKTTSATNLSVTLNGNTRDGVYSGGIQKEKPLYLFANNNDGNNQKASIRVRSFYIKDNGALVRDFVPAQNSDGKIGMYDLVGGRFYENAGTGEFIAGNPVVE